MCGTEVQTNEVSMCNRLVIGTIDYGKDITTQFWSYPINEVREMKNFIKIEFSMFEIWNG